MKKLLALLLVCMSILLTLQAKERTVEEALANSEIAMEKVRQFQADFGKQDRPKLSTIEYRPVNIKYIEQFKMNGKIRYYDIDIDLETSSSKDDVISVLPNVIRELKLPMDRGFYMYQEDKTVDEKMLNFLQKRVNVKSLKIRKLVLQ